MTPSLHLTAIAQLSAERIVYCLVEGMLVAAFTALLLRVVRRQNAGTRFAVWFAGLVAIAVLPILGGPWWANGRDISTGVSASRAAITLPGSWALYLFAVWATIAGLGLLRVASAVWQLHRLRKSCIRIDVQELDPALCETLSHSQTGRAIAFCVSDRVQTPTAIGLTNPAVVLPRWLLQELSAKELQQILLHEVAHLRRWDDWTNLAQKILKALLFFHPAVWWIERKMSLEREMACDDAVLVETSSPRAYAECLAHLAEKTFIRRSVALAQAAVGHIGQTTLRVARILDRNRPGATTRVWRPAVSLVAAFAIACLLLVLRAPKLVVFEDAVSNTLVATASPAPGLRPVAAKFVQDRANPRQASTRRLVTPRFPAIEAKAQPVNTESQLSGLDLVFPAESARFENSARFVPVKDSVTDRFAVSETVLVFVMGTQRGAPEYGMYHMQTQMRMNMSVWRITVLPPRSNRAEKAYLQKII